ncbi:ninjurin-1-like isoform X3 [Harmonia axyridis]|uniref:ninjurin-1-like isoform X3 n=1 Tax=Harmonia axyridis TaxID=115357 RepID=UPI001E279821|nr:ninjurin-1-like isoform X3 [Harmonia axyridis]
MSVSVTAFSEKTLDPNKYATKKTIAQGLLDVALLTANASQLKYILQVGPKHEFYTLMLSLIIVSIILQVTGGVVALLVYVKMDHTRNHEYNKVAWILNHINLGLVTSAMFCDIIKMNFGLDPAITVLTINETSRKEL